MPLPTPTPWLVVARPKPAARVRLVCFPFAGGSASVFHTWGDGLPPDVEVCAVQLPGREMRLGEPLLRDVPSIVEALAPAALPHLSALPFAFFGHSLGARVGYELARHLRRRFGLEPVHFFASACRAPQFPSTSRRHELPDERLIDEMRRLGGTPEALLRERELMQVFLPIVRADLQVVETYAYEPGPPLHCPITALHGRHDRDISGLEAEGWREHTAGAFALRPVEAGHFFLVSHREQILRWVAEALAERTPLNHRRVGLHARRGGCPAV